MKEEILALVSDTNKKGVKKEDINDYVLVKISFNCYIEIKINKYKNKDKKIFIFIVYMSRIVFEEVNNIENKKLEEKVQFIKKFW